MLVHIWQQDAQVYMKTELNNAVEVANAAQAEAAEVSKECCPFLKFGLYD